MFTEIRVAIFEDNHILRNSLQLLVDSAPDFLCTGSYANARQVIRSILLAKPDVVLMDINMPGVSGIEAIHLIKEKYPGIKVLVQTVFEEDDKIFAAVCAGASGYMLKKTAPAAMLEAIRETYAGGAPMTPSVASRVLQMFRIQNKDANNEYIGLSDREKEILALLVNGRSYKQIANECFVSIDTVSTHVRHIYDKLHVHSKSEAVAKAIRQKLI